MPPGIDPGGFQSQGEFSDAVGLTRETLGFSLGANVIQVNLNESGAVLTEYLSTTTTGGTVAFDSNDHSGAQSLRIARTSNALVGARGFTLPGVLNNGDAGTSFSWNFWVYANTLPSSATHVEIASAAFNNADNVLVMLNSAGEVRLSRQNGLTGGALSAPSPTLITAGSWYQINVTYDFTQLALTTCTLAVNTDTPVFYAITNRYGPNDIHTGVRYGTMTAAVTASTYDICFDDQYLYRTPPSNTLLLYNNENEYSVITSTEYDNVVTTGGTVALSSAQKHSGSQSVRVNRTSNAAVYAETLTLTKPSLGPGGLQHAELSGSFWVYVASYPSGVGDTIITTIYHPVNSNLDITMSNTGRVKIRQQDGTLAGGANQSSYSASTVALNTWTQIFWTNDGNTGTMVGTVAVGSDAPVSVTWSQAAEVPPWIDYGSRQMTAASNYDIYFDDQVVYEGATYPVTSQPNVVFPSSTSAGTSTAVQGGLKIRLPNRTSASSSTTSNNALSISIPFPSTPILDSFTWPNGTLSVVNTQWRRQLRSSTTNALLVSSNQVTSSVAPADSYYGSSPFPADQEAYVTIGSVSSTYGVELWVRVANPGNPGGNTLNGYFVDYDADQGPSNGALSIGRALNGNITFLTIVTLPSDLSTGDKLGIRVKGSKIEVYTKLGAAAWSQVLALTDTNVTAAGYIGLWTNDSGPPTTFFDDFGGGAYNTFSLPSVTSAGSSTATAAGLRIKLPNLTSAGTSTADETAPKIRLPSRTSAGASTATATALRIRLPSRTTAGTGTLAGNNIKIRLPNRTSAGTSTGTATVLMSLLPVRTTAGTSTASATALLIRLPNRTSAGVGTLSGNNVKIRLPARTTAGTATTNQAGLRDRIGIVTTAGTSTATQSGLRIRLPNRTTAGTSTAAATALRISLPSRTSAGVGSLSGNNIKIRLPSRTSAGTSSCTFGLRIILPARSTAGSSTATATALRIGLPTRTSAGTSTATQSGLKIRLPSRTSAGVGSVTTALRIRLPAVTSAGSTGTPANIQLARDHGLNSSASASTTLTIPTTAAVAAGDYLVITGTSSSGTATVSSIAVTSGTDPGNLSWTTYDQVGNATGAFIAFTRCPTGVNNAVTFTVTWTGVAFGTRRLGLTEWSGLAGASAEDTHQGAVSSSSGTDPTVNIVTANANDLVIAGVSIQTATTLTPNGTFIEIHDDNGGSRTHGTIYQIETATGTFAPGADAALNNHWAISAIALKAAGTGSGLSANNIKIQLPARTSAGVGTTSSTGLNITGGGATLANVSSAGTSSASQGGLRIRLPARSVSGTGATSAPLRILLPSVTSVGAASTTKTYTQMVAADKPIDWWHLDESSGATATDSTGTNNGTYSGTIVYAQSSVVPFGGGTSVDLGSAAGKINVADVNDFIGNVPYSVEVWTQFKQPILTGVFDAAFRWVVGKQVPAVGRSGWGLGYYFGQSSNSSGPNSGRFFFERWNNDASNGLVWPASPPIQINPDRQYHVVATYDGANLRLYVNGLLINTSSAGLALPDTTAQIALGAFNSANAAAFRGKMDEVAIYDYALNLNQVKAHFSAGNGYALQIREPNVTTGGTSNATATGLRIQLSSRTTAGTSTATQAGLKIRLPNRSDAGTSTSTATTLRIRMASRTSAGSGSLAQTGLRIRLPNRSAAGVGTTTATVLSTGFIATSAGHGNATCTGLKIRLPGRTSSGTSTATTTGNLRDRLPAMVSAGQSSLTSVQFQIRLPSINLGYGPDVLMDPDTPLPSSPAYGNATATGLQIRLPARVAVGISTTTAGYLRAGLNSVASGTSGGNVGFFQIKLPPQTSTGVGSTEVRGFVLVEIPPHDVVILGSGHAAVTVDDDLDTVTVGPNGGIIVDDEDETEVVGGLTRSVNVGM